MVIESGALCKVKFAAKVGGQLLESRTAVLPIGKNYVITGFDEALLNADVGKQAMVVVPSEKAYGNRNAELVRLVPMEVFRRQGVEPVAGMPVELDGLPAKVQSVSSGRVRVDFNHELAGKDIEYDFTVEEELTTPLRQVDAIMVDFLVEGFKASLDEKTKTALVEVNSATATRKGYIAAKGRAIAMVLTFVDVQSVKFTEEYSKSAISEPSATGSNV